MLNEYLPNISRLFTLAFVKEISATKTGVLPESQRQHPNLQKRLQETKPVLLLQQQKLQFLMAPLIRALMDSN